VKPLRVWFAPVTAPTVIAVIATLVAPMLLLGASAASFPANIPPLWLFGLAIAVPLGGVFPVAGFVLKRTARGWLREVPGGWMFAIDGVVHAFDRSRPVDVSLGRTPVFQLGDQERRYVWARFAQGEAVLTLGYYGGPDAEPSLPEGPSPGPSYELVGFRTNGLWREVVERLRR
jgi:hypothetical protein